MRLPPPTPRDILADAFTVAKQRPADRSLDDVINVTSHRSLSLATHIRTDTIPAKGLSAALARRWRVSAEFQFEEKWKGDLQ